MAMDGTVMDKERGMEDLMQKYPRLSCLPFPGKVDRP
jgi:hypothetical protein